METPDRTKAPELHELNRMSMPEPRSYLLDNGVTLNILDGGSEEANRLTVVLDGGLAEAEKKFEPRLAAQLLSEGSAGYTSSEIAEHLDFNGSWYKGTGHGHHLSATLFSLNSGFDKVLPIFMDMIQHPTFSDKEVSICSETMARNRELELEKVSYYAAEAAQKMMIGNNHPLNGFATPDEIREITPDHLRKSYSDRLAAGRLSIYFAGRITPKMERAVADAFSKIAEGRGIAPVIKPGTPTTGVRIDIPRPDTLQSAVHAVLPTISRNHPDYVMLRIAVMALGGYFGSRLTANIREDKGYTYGISASLVGQPEGGALKIETECGNRYVESVIAEIRKEVELLASKPLTPQELDMVKRHYMTTLVGQLDSPFSMIDYHLTRKLVGTPSDYFDRQQDALAAISAEEIMRVADTYLNPSDLSFAIAGNPDPQD